MSFLSDLFHGNFGNLGEDLAPSNIFKDFGSSFSNQPTWAKALEIALPAVALGGVGLGALADVGVGAAAEGGLAAAETAGAGAGELGGLTAADVTFADPEMMAAMTGEAAIPADVTAPAVSTATPGLGLLPAGDTTVAPSIAEAGGFGDTAMGPSFLNTPVGPDVAFTGGDFTAGTPGVAGGGGAGSVFGPAPTPFDPGMGAQPIPFGGTDAATAAATGTAAPPAGGTFGSNFMQSLSAFPGKLGTALGNPMTDLGIAGLGLNLYGGYQSQQALKKVQQQVADAANQAAGARQAALGAAQPMINIGEAMMTGGQLPGPVKAMLDNFRNSQRARVIQSYTSQGQSGDINKNTMLAQDLNAVDNQVLALQETIGKQFVDTANSLLSSGLSATQISAELPMMMQRLDIALEQVTSNSIANFAAAMSGGTMKVAGQGTGFNLNLNTPGATASQTLLGA